MEFAQGFKTTNQLIIVLYAGVLLAASILVMDLAEAKHDSSLADRYSRDNASLVVERDHCRNQARDLAEQLDACRDQLAGANRRVEALETQNAALRESLEKQVDKLRSGN